MPRCRLDYDFVISPGGIIRRNIRQILWSPEPGIRRTGQISRGPSLAESMMPPVNFGAEPVRRGLALLLDAYDAADESHCDAWEFAVEFDVLRQTGLSITDLRRLVVSGQVLHAIESTPRRKSARRAVRRVSWLTFRPDSCFSLAAAAIPAIRASLGQDETDHTEGTAPGIEEAVKPHWDESRRRLSVADDVVKEFLRAGTEQEVILSTFEDDGWPAWIDDPLPVQAGAEPKVHLRAVVKYLNRNQKSRRIRFSVGSAGDRVYWALR